MSRHPLDTVFRTISTSLLVPSPCTQSLVPVSRHPLDTVFRNISILRLNHFALIWITMIWSGHIFAYTVSPNYVFLWSACIEYRKNFVQHSRSGVTTVENIDHIINDTAQYVKFLWVSVINLQCLLVCSALLGCCVARQPCCSHLALHRCCVWLGNLLSPCTAPLLFVARQPALTLHCTAAVWLTILRSKLRQYCHWQLGQLSRKSVRDFSCTIA